jgi:hypothetical protein
MPKYICKIVKLSAPGACFPVYTTASCTVELIRLPASVWGTSTKLEVPAESISKITGTGKTSGGKKYLIDREEKQIPCTIIALESDTVTDAVDGSSAETPIMMVVGSNDYAPRISIAVLNNMVTAKTPQGKRVVKYRGKAIVVRCTLEKLHLYKGSN